MNPIRTTSTDYRNPYRPTPIRLLNTIARTLGLRASLDRDSLLKAAQRQTGLTHFGSDAFRQPLQQMLDAIHTEAQLHPVGEWITRQRLIGILANRLRLQATLTTHPDIRTRPIQAPIVIVGLQRTGTTFLHRLLGADPRLRALASWEGLNPAPWPRRAWRARPHPDPRIGAARQAERALAYMAPDFFAIHPVEAESPEEEVVLLEHTFLSTTAEALMHVPTFSAWLETQDQTPAYRHLAQLLQCLQWQRGPTRWVLKTPHHLEWLDTLLEVFPNATLVWTHRDPLVTIASFCSMIAHARGVFSNHVDPIAIGAHWSRKILRMLNRGMDTRANRPKLNVVDVHYADLLRDPLAIIARIYDAAGLELTSQARQTVEQVRRASPQHRYGRHIYRMADFGLDPNAIDLQLQRYRNTFAVPRSH